MTNELAVLVQQIQTQWRVPIVQIEIFDVVLAVGLLATWAFAWRCCARIAELERKVTELETKASYLQLKLGELYAWALGFYTDYKVRIKVCCKLESDPTFPPVSDPKWP